MDSILQFSNNIKILVKSGRYQEAIDFFKTGRIHFSNQQITENAQIIASMLNTFRQLGQFETAFLFLKVFHIKVSTESQEYLLTAYSWLLHSFFKSKNEDDFVKEEPNHNKLDKSVANRNLAQMAMVDFDIKKEIANLIIWLQKYQTVYTYSASSSLFNLLLKKEKQRKNPDWMFVNDFCDSIDFTKLSEECKTTEILIKGQKKIIELASDKENWFAYKTKALEKLGKYDDCCRFSIQALEGISRFHYSNDIWFARRIAVSKKNTGKIDEAIIELIAILSKKKEWFIQKELAELYILKDENKKALEYAILGMKNYGALEYKIDLLCTIGDLLMKEDKIAKAYKHYLFSKLIRVKNGWKIPSRLNDSLIRSKKKELTESFDTLKSELESFWKASSIPASLPKNILIGLVKKIVHNNEKGIAGFIQFGKKESVYFTLKADDPIKKLLTENAKVKFRIVMQQNNKSKAISLRINE